MVRWHNALPRAEYSLSRSPEGVDDETAALPNLAISAWLSLAFRAKLMPGKNVLIVGATVGDW